MELTYMMQWFGLFLLVIIFGPLLVCSFIIGSNRTIWERNRKLSLLCRRFNKGLATEGELAELRYQHEAGLIRYSLIYQTQPNAKLKVMSQASLSGQAVSELWLGR